MDYDLDYINILMHAPHMTPMGLLTTFFLILFRLAPIVALAPFFGAKVAPMPARVGLAICLAVVFLPSVISHSTHPLNFNMEYLGYSLKELLIGLILGFFISIPFFVAQTSGSLIDFMRGSSFMMSQDITMQVQTSPIGTLYNYILIVMFYQLDGPFLFINAVADSYRIIPADGFINPLFFAKGTTFWKSAMDIINHIFKIAIQVSAPALLGILMAETFLGIANRLAPQVQISFLGMSLKSLAGLGILWLGWFFILKQLGKDGIDWVSHIEKLLRGIPVLSAS